MKIKVRLSEKGLDDAINEVLKYKSDLNEKAKQFAAALANKGLNVAEIKFKNAKYAGENDVECRVSENGTKCTIIAEGKAVAFIEFGTGVTHPPYGGQLPEGVGEHGTYGQGKGAHKRWYYYGEPGNAGVPVSDKKGLNYTSGNDAAMAMWGAVEEMAAQVESTWREVWMND